MTSYQQRQSLVINTLRWPLTVAVLVIHVLSFEAQAFVGGDWGHNAYVFASELVSHQLFRAVVPCFFVFSGYYLFAGRSTWTTQGYVQELLKRVRTLLIPYLLWNLGYMLLIYLKGQASSLVGIAAPEAEALRTHSVWELLWVPINYPLWYVRDLMFVSLLSPLFYWGLRASRPLAGLLLLLAIYLAPVPRTILTGDAVVFFGLGVYFAVHGFSLLECARRLGWRALALWLGVGAISLLVPSVYWQRVLIPAGIFAMLWLGDRLVEHCPRATALCHRLLPTSFFVYAIHLAYIESWVKGAFARTPLYESGWGMLVAYILIPIVTLGICLGLYYGLRRVAPRVLGVLCGGRG